MPDYPVPRRTAARTDIGRLSRRLAPARTHWSTLGLREGRWLPVLCSLFPPSDCTYPADHCRLYIRLAAPSARVQPARLPRASNRLARGSDASNVVCARASARATEPGVGWRSSWASIDWRAVGPASGLFTDCRTACSNCAIALLQGPACAVVPRNKIGMTKAAVTLTTSAPGSTEEAALVSCH